MTQANADTFLHSNRARLEKSALAGAAPLQLELTAAETVCFAMECAAVPLMKDVKIASNAAGDLLGAQLGVTLLPGLGSEQLFPIPALHPGETVSLPVVDLRLDPGWLRAVVEREPSELVVRVLSGGQELAKVSRKVQVLAFSEWPGLRSPIGILASFVMPNEPCLATLLRAVGEDLLSTTRDAAILAYQSGSLGRARAEVTALYKSVCDVEIRYVGVAPSFEEVGQKVRLVENVFADKLANCLDITLLFASALEAMGFAPLVILLDSHAFCGVWLEDERFPEGVVEDSARLRTLCQLGSLVVFEATAALSDRPFAEAQALALNHLASEERFAAALDIRVLRRARYLPLPIRRDRHQDVVARFPPSEASNSHANEPPAASNAPATTTDASHETVVEARFRRWKENLLDLTLRNRLLNFRLASKSALRLEVPDPELFEDILAADRALQILPRPAESALRSQELLLRREADAAEVNRGLQADLAKAIIYSPDTESELWERAISLDRAARRDLEEGGVATLFAAVGLLRWYESATSDEARIAPLLLYPVQLEFDRRSRRLRLRRQPEDPIANQTLIEKLRLEYEVDLSALAALDADESGLDVKKLFRSAREAIQQMPRWEVMPEVHLGLFSFSKFLMWKDLDANADRLLQNAVVRRIADKRPAEEVVARAEVNLAELDSSVTPAATPCVLDLDGTQLGAVATALNGQSLVLQGPPGTGKSQTITSLIAAAIGQGKTVLFVSEKMAALEVVHRRLRDVGVSDFCLELHSHKTNKKDMIASFKAVLERPGDAEAANWDHSCEEVMSLRTSLNDYVRALHRTTPLGMSYYEVTGRLEELKDRANIELQLAGIERCTDPQFQGMLRGVSEFVELAGRVHPVDEHPWRASTRTQLDAAAEQPLLSLIERSVTALDALRHAFGRLSTRLGYVGAGSWNDLGQVADAADALIRGIRDLDREAQSGPIANAVHNSTTWPALVHHAGQYVLRRSAFERQSSDLSLRWQDGFVQQDVAALSSAFEKGARSFFSWFMLRKPRRALLPVARGALPATEQIRRDLLAALELPELRRAIAPHEGALAAGLRDVWEIAKQSIEALPEVVRRSERFRDAWVALTARPGFAQLRVTDVHTGRRAALDLERDVAELRSAHHAWHALEIALRSELQLTASFWPDASTPGGPEQTLGWLRYWCGQVPQLRPWCQYLSAKSALVARGLAGVPDALSSGVTPEALSESFEASFLRRWRVAHVDANPILREFVGASHHARVARFAALDAQHQLLSRVRVAQILEQALPRKGSALKGSELDVLLRECQKKARHLPVRKLLAAIPALRAKLKPCLLMSPLSVAQYLPAEATFDLVVFDEASQIETHDAIGAIARGRQVVIVGDSKQLPPTRFFSRRSADESPANENDVEDLDSILDEALAKGLPQLSLGWHYRSRHDSLISFSNEQYYGKRLQVFPAARRYVEDLGVAWHATPPNGYQPGDGPKGRTNPPEAQALVAYLVDALLAHAPSERTFGVVTFSLSQMTLIENLLDDARAANPTLEAHFSGSEKVFVKNLESVQGDERDEILFSICYGRDAANRMRHHFGPLSLGGGERRLNVAITRARKQLRVFSSMTHQDIDLRRTRARGAEDLRRFLEFVAIHDAAREQQNAKPKVFSSIIEREIHDELSAAGYSVHTKVGAGEFQLDLAVLHPKDARVYALAVEADGPTYRDAPVARDRDRLRGAVLHDMLWHTHRVWSPDWVANRSQEVRRLLEAAASATATVLSPKRPSPPPIQTAAALPSPDTNFPSQGADPAMESPPLPAMTDAAKVAPAPRAYRGELPYAVASLLTYSADGEDMYRPQARRLVGQALAQLVQAEAPIHCSLAYRRVVGCWGYVKLGRRAQEHLDAVVQELAAARQLHLENEFLWRSPTQAGGYRGFRRGGPEGRPRDAEHIPAQELANALASVLSEALSAPEEELLRETARALGIERIGSRVGPALQRGLQHLLDRGSCVREAQHLRWTDEGHSTTQSTPAPPRSALAHAAATTLADVAPARAGTLQQLLGHPAVRSRLETCGLSEPSLAAALGLLLKQSGRASTREFAAALGVPEYRVPGLVASLAQVLNIDAYQVVRLSTQGGTVELDRDILRQAFDVSLVW